ncbi:MAG TPA: hypothetical protein VGC09_00465 [Rhodopila sp.]
MTVLHLGEIAQPYAMQGGIGTVDVARILEAKYHIMQSFYRMHEVNVAKYVENSLAGTLENLMMGAPVRGSPYAGAESAIETRFREFLMLNEIEGAGIPGVPTMAAMKGISHRFKGKRSGSPRPSFIDTGLFETSFRAWFD